MPHTFQPQPPLYETWRHHSRSAGSPNAVVATHHPDASHAAYWALDQGGNAIDAAVAAALALTVCEPWASGLGGGGFATLFSNHDQKTHSIAFETPAPLHTDPNLFQAQEETDHKTQDIFSWPKVNNELNRHGPLSSGIPAAVAGYAHAIECFGRLSWKQVITPACELAKQGHRITWWSSIKTLEQAHLLKRYPESAKFWLPGGTPIAMQESITHSYMPLEALERTLRQLKDEGPMAFYQGSIAEALLNDVNLAGGTWCEQDLLNISASTLKPLSLQRGETTIHVPPGLCAGTTLLETLSSPFASKLDATLYTNIAQRLRQSTRDRLQHQGHKNEPGCTSTVSVIDREGNCIALTTTLLSIFGSKWTSSQTGILLNNSMYWFNPTPNHPNSIAPGKKPLTNMCPTVVTRAGKAQLALAGSGGRRILPAIMQVLSFMLDAGLSLEEALNAPRIDTSEPERIIVPPELDSSITKALEAIAPIETYSSLCNPNPYAVLTAVEQASKTLLKAHASNAFPLCSCLGV